MRLESVHEKATLQSFLEQDRGRYAYLLGDLAPFFWGRTLWFAATEGSGIRALMLLYLAHKRPVALLFGQEQEALSWLWREVTPVLPSVVDLHIEQWLIPHVEASGWSLRHQEPHLRMVLQGDPPEVNMEGLVLFTERDLPLVECFYQEAYPKNFFDPQMLATERYVGYLADGEIVAIAGVHTVSRECSVAALGNIATHPAHRSKGLAQIVTAALCRFLKQDGISTIALNVHHQNSTAIRLYQRLGFVEHMLFLEALGQKT